MRIAMAISRAPYPLNSGGRIRSFHFLKELSAAHEVTLITAVDGPADEAALSELTHLIPGLAVRASDAPSRYDVAAQRARTLLNPIDPVPYTWVRYRNDRFRRTAAAALAQTSFDLLHCDHVQLAYAFERLSRPARVLNAHNVEHQIFRRIAQEQPYGYRRLLFSWQAAKIRRAEARAHRAFDGSVAVSALDRAEIERMAPTASVSVVPNGVDVDAFVPVESQPVPGRMTLVGAMDWLPNADAAAFFTEQVMPRIRRRMPTAHLRLVGRDPNPALVRRLSGPGIEFTGTVDDVRPELASAALIVVPLRIGGGTRLKILEAWAMGKAVLSTSIGAEGLPAVDRENIALADGPEALAERAVDLLADRPAAAALASAGRRIVLERFSWKRIVGDLLAAYEHAVAAHGRRQRNGAA